MYNVENLDFNSEYDFYLHLPVPKLEFIRTLTGIDLLEYTDGLVQAQAEVKMYSLLASRIIYADKSRNSAQDLEFLIATDLEYRKDFITFVAYFVFDIFNNGLIEQLNTIKDSSSLKNNLTPTCLAVLNGGKLQTLKFDRLPSYDYRVGY